MTKGVYKPLALSVPKLIWLKNNYLNSTHLSIWPGRTKERYQKEKFVFFTDLCLQNIFYQPFNNLMNLLFYTHKHTHTPYIREVHQYKIKWIPSTTESLASPKICVNFSGAGTQHSSGHSMLPAASSLSPQFLQCPPLSFLNISWHGSKPFVLLSWKVLCTQFCVTDFPEGLVAIEGNYSTK